MFQSLFYWIAIVDLGYFRASMSRYNVSIPVRKRSGPPPGKGFGSGEKGWMGTLSVVSTDGGGEPRKRGTVL